MIVCILDRAVLQGAPGRCSTVDCMAATRSRTTTSGAQGGAECGVQSAECRVQSAECRVQSAECRVQSAECRVQGAVQSLKVPSNSLMCCYLSR